MQALVCFHPRAEPHARLICFPHAGGGPHAFSELGLLVPEWIEVHVVSYAGRGERYAERFPESFEAACSEAYAAIRAVSDRPIALLGHSFGCLLALECGRRLAVNDDVHLLRLIVSSCAEPRRKRRSRSSSLSELSDAALVTELAARGWLPAAASGGGSKGLLEHALPPLRADLALYEGYEPPSQLVSMRVTALGGGLDASVPLEALEAWKEYTSHAVDPSSFDLHIVEDGGHFHIESHAKEMAATIESTIRDALGRLPSSALVGPAATKLDSDDDDDETIVDVFRKIAKSDKKDELAILDGDTTLTFAQLRRAATMVAENSLRPRGVRKGAVVAVYLPPSASYCVANLAIFEAQGAMVYFEVNYTTSLIEQLLEASGAVCVLTNRSLGANLPKNAAALYIEDAYVSEQDDEDIVFVSPISDGKTSRLEPSSLAYCSMSSGTTGKPKAILVEHRSVFHNFFARDLVYPYSDDDREGCNIFFVWEALRAPLHGRLMVVIPDSVVVDARRLVGFLKQHKITRCMLTPSLLRNVLDQPGLDAHRMLKHLRYVMLEGEIVPWHLVNKFQRIFHGGGPQLVNYYSTWESLDTATASLSSMMPSSSSSLAPVGRPLPGLCLLVVDRETGRVVPRGVPGFVFVVAASIARGYLADPEKTKARFLENPLQSLADDDPAVRVALGEADPDAVERLLGDDSVRCYDTGDRGVALSDGTLVLLGRADSTVKIRGFKVALEYVRTTALDCPVVESCVVRPVLDPSTQQPQALVAYFVSNDANGKDNAVSILREHFKTALPEYAVPSHVVALDALPTKPGSGKLDYSQLPPPTDRHKALFHDSDEKKAKGSPSSSSSSFGRLAAREIQSAFESTLQRKDISRDANFFELGGHSLHAAKIVGTIAERLGVEIAVVDLFERPSVEALAALLVERRGAVDDAAASFDPLLADSASFVQSMTPLAVTGAACLLPGASDVAEFWRNLTTCHDSLTEFSVAELATRGVPPSLMADPAFVPKGQMIQGDEVVAFDAFFWGIGAAEARVMDPQHRKLLEASWRAREASARGYRLSQLDREDDVGVFASSGIDGYMIHHLQGAPLRDAADPGSVFMGEVGSEKDYAPTRVSYQLGLRGPSVAINSACSSALVAAAMAAHSVTVGECSSAIVAAASITFPNLGYVYVDGLVGSKDGIVRPLDADASGTLFGDGVGALCLEAVAEEDSSRRQALAIVLGAAVTNDGRLKAGYTAPSAEAQALAISRSTRRARIPRLDYVELHATATKLGDAIEVAGLSRALKSLSASAGVASDGCFLGSVKGNIGHANCAAGFTGLLKACLTITHAICPPTAHFKTLNPKISGLLPEGALIVAHGHAPPQITPTNGSVNADEAQRFFGGVSSFGVGGTNAHLTLASPPPHLDAARDAGGYYGDVKIRRRRRSSRKTHYWRVASDDTPHGAAAKPALASEAVAAATFAAIRDAAAVAAVAVGLDQANAKQQAMQAVQQLRISTSSDHYSEAVRKMSPRKGGLFDDDDVSDSLSTVPPPPKSAESPRGYFASTRARPISRINSLDALLDVIEDQDGDNNSPKTSERMCASANTTPTKSPPKREKSSDKKRTRPKRRRAEVVVVSAKTEASLRESVAKIAAFMRHCVDEDEDVYLSDVAKTLQEGREHFRDWRIAVSASTLKDAADALERATPSKRRAETANDDVICLEIGAGKTEDLELGAGRRLFETNADFRGRLQACASVLDAPLRQLPSLGAISAPGGLLDALGYSIDQADFRPDKSATFSTHGRSSLLAAKAVLTRPAVAQPATFALLYSLAACFSVDNDADRDDDDDGDHHIHDLDANESRRPSQRLVLQSAPFFAAVAGRGVGQLVALTLDGGITLDDALLLCCERGRLIEEQSAGTLTKTPAEVLESYVASRLEDRVSYLRSPRRAAVADNVSGGWLSLFDVKDATYWGLHLEAETRQDECDRWSSNVAALDRYEPTLVVSIDVLGAHNACCANSTRRNRVQCDIGYGDSRDQKALSDALAAAWCAGLAVDWRAVRLAARGKSSLAREAKFVAGVPGYSFAKTSHWVSPRASVYAPLTMDKDEDVKSQQFTTAPSQKSAYVVVKRRRQYSNSAISARLVCAPFAGGSSAAFSGAWVDAAPSWLEIAAIEWAGRGSRADERLPESDADDEAQRNAVREAVVAHVTADSSSKPWALVGLSAGGLFVIELYTELVRSAPHSLAARRALDSLSFVCIAGRAPPPRELEAPRAIPDDKEILDVYALVPPETRKSEAFINVAFPRLRADLAADARAEFRVSQLCAHARAAVVGAPVVIIGGLDDPSFPPGHATCWRDLLRSRRFEARFVDGGHEFLVEKAAEIVADLVPRFPSPAALPLHEDDDDPSSLYAVRWEHVASQVDESFVFNDEEPVTRLCDISRVLLDEGDEEIIEEAAAFAARTGSLLLDGLVGNHQDSKHPMDWIERDEAEAWSLVRLLQAIAETSDASEVTLVCRASARGALAAGATKCARYEFGPSFFLRRVYVRASAADVDRATLDGSRDDLVRRAARIAHEAARRDEDVLLLQRNDLSWRVAVPRARPLQVAEDDEVAETDAATWLLSGGRTVIVTGATGGLGRALFEWLDKRINCQRIVLVGRRRPQLPFWDETKHVFVSVGLDSLENARKAFANERDVGAIFHLAGALEDATLASLDREKFATPIAPKARGLVVLRQVAAELRWPTKAIVAYSSTTSLFGFGGQTNYASANALLDAFADFGDDDLGQVPVVSIQWGPWAEAGMAAVGTKARE